MGVRSRWQALDLARQQGCFEETNTSKFLEAISEERSKLTHEMYVYIKSLKSLSPEDRRKQAHLVTMYDMIFDGSYNYPSLW